MIVYVVAKLSAREEVRDLGPEIFNDEDRAWAAADALNGRLRAFRQYGCDVERGEYTVIRRRLWL